MFILLRAIKEPHKSRMSQMGLVPIPWFEHIRVSAKALPASDTKSDRVIHCIWLLPPHLYR